MIFLYGKKIETEKENSIISEFKGHSTQEGIRFIKSNTYEWNEKEVYRFKYDDEDDDHNHSDTSIQPPRSEPWVSAFRFLSAGCVCFMNIQTLNYGRGKEVIYNSNISAKSLHEKMKIAAEAMRSASTTPKD
ncbi:hypothetical protein D7Y44_02815 [Stenotrophomonas maltophilia]|nr:hypothetical protein [Stenotrophomonas maltophilia]